MLEERKLVGVIIRKIVEQTIHQAVTDGGAGVFDRPDDCLRQLCTHHARNQIDSPVNGFWQASKVHAIAEEIRPQSQDDVNWYLILFGSCQQQFN